MTRNEKRQTNAIILTLLVTFMIHLCQDEKSRKGGSAGENKTDTMTHVKWDTIRAKPIWSLDTICTVIYDTGWRTAQIDTASILQEFHNRNIYKRNWSDSFAQVCITDTVFNNRIFSGPIEATYKQKTVTTTIVSKPIFKAGLTIGAGIGLGHNLVLLPVQVGYLAKSGRHFQAGPFFGSTMGILLNISTPIKR